MTEQEQKRVFGMNLSRFLNERDKTQKEVAEAIGVLPSTFNTWVKGVSIPRMDKIQALADYFGTTKTSLLDERTPYDIQQELIDDYMEDSKIRELVLFAGGVMPKESRDKYIDSIIQALTAFKNATK